MRVKIVSDGTCSGTRLISCETGEPIENIVHIRWELRAGHREWADCVVTLKRVALEFEGEVDVLPDTGHLTF